MAPNLEALYLSDPLKKERGGCAASVPGTAHCVCNYMFGIRMKVTSGPLREVKEGEGRRRKKERGGKRRG